MRLFGNAIQQYYGQLTILAPPGNSALILLGSSANAAAIFQNGGGGAQFIQGGAGVSAITEYAGNANTSGVSSLAVGQASAGGSVILARGAQSLSIGVNGGGQIAISATGALTFTDTTGSVWGAATGGAKGSGTINCLGVFVNGVAVGGGGATILVASHASGGSTSNATTSVVLDTSLNVSVTVTGIYRVEVFAEYSATVGSAGFKIGMGTGTGTATQTNFTGVAAVQSGVSTVVEQLQDSSAGSTLSFTTGITNGGFVRLVGTVVITGTGTFGFGWSCNAAGTVTLSRGNIVLTKVG